MEEICCKCECLVSQHTIPYIIEREIRSHNHNMKHAYFELEAVKCNNICYLKAGIR